MHGSLGSMDMDDLLKNMYTEEHAERNEIVAGVGGGGGGGGEVGMTLEAYLAKAGAVSEEEVRGGFGMEMVLENCLMDGFCGNGVVEVGGMSGGGGGGGGRGKRRVGEEVGLDKVIQMKQRRMIKNRESATRSRERKQAYTVELEALVSRLEEENARLLKEKAEVKKQRFKQLMEKVETVVENRRSPKAVIHRSLSMTW